MIEITLLIAILVFIATLFFESYIIKNLKKEKEAITNTLNSLIKDYDALKEENLYLYQQLKEYQDKETKKTTRRTTTRKAITKKETTKKQEDK